MSTSNVPQRVPAANESGKPGFAWRPLLIGMGIILLAGAVILLSISTPASRPAVAGNASLLVLVPAAFLAGIFSFLSPCTLPILPAYFAFTFQARRERIVVMTIAFFLGLATTMVILGASATALSRLLFRNLDEITLVGGLVVVAFGIMSILGKGFTGMQMADRPAASVAGSYFYGMTFALGWTACVGPILGALLTLLATQGVAVIQGALLAFVYALGLGSPLILVATFFSRLGQGSRFWQMMRGRGMSINLGFTTLHTHSTSLISGVLLVIVGALLASGQMTALSEWMLTTPMATWALDLEQWVQRLFFSR